MAAERYVVGIDCSTTATKAVVWDERGNSVAEGRAAFPLEAPRPGWYEQDAEEWWRSIKTALKEAAAQGWIQGSIQGPRHNPPAGEFCLHGRRGPPPEAGHSLAGRQVLQGGRTVRLR